MFTTPGLFAEVTTKLADGPVVQPVVVELPAGVQRLVILWRELPKRVAAVLVAISGVLWLMVSPTAPAASRHAVELLQNYRPAATQPVVAETPEHPAPAVPRPRKRTREVERVTTQERRRSEMPLTVRAVPVGNPG